MPRSSTFQLVDDLARGLADPATREGFYRDVLFDLARQPILVEATLLPSVEGATSYAWPPSAVRLLAVFFDDAQLALAGLAELKWYGEAWRDISGQPAAYVTEGEPTRTLRLFPAPDRPSKAFSFVFGAPLGRDFPASAVAVLTTVFREDAPAWLDLPIALEVCAREFDRESDHRDAAMAASCRRLANAVFGMVL